MIEEERRLLYVAMTRARNELHLCCPLKYPGHAAGRKTATNMCIGAKSRFMTDKVLESLRTASLRNLRGVEIR